MKKVIRESLYIIVSVLLLTGIVSCDDECPADEGTVTVIIKNFKVDKNDEGHYKWPILEVSPCYDKSITLYWREMTNKTSYTEKVILNTGDYLVTVTHPATFGIKSNYVQVRRGQNVELVIDAKAKK